MDSISHFDMFRKDSGYWKGKFEGVSNHPRTSIGWLGLCGRWVWIAHLTQV
jgi:hypothetical protein